MELNREQKRAIARLRTNPDYQLLLSAVVKSRLESALETLQLAHGVDATLEAAHRVRNWHEIFTLLDTYPQVVIEELKQEGDEVYG